jgi:hypothetical protein
MSSYWRCSLSLTPRRCLPWGIVVSFHWTGSDTVVHMMQMTAQILSASLVLEVGGGREGCHDQARVSLLAQPTGAVACEMCGAEGMVPNAAVVVGHPHGGIVQLAGCDWCERTLRRLAAATGGQAAFALAEGGIPAPAGRRLLASGARPASPPVLVHEFAEPVRDPADGATYVVRVFGQARADGTWEGWLEFVAVGAAVVPRTDQESTQSNREGVTYWASGLEPAYLEGAFARVRRDRSPAMSA